MEQPGVVAENHKVRGLGAGLGHIVDLQAAALIRGRLHPGGGIRQDAVQGAGGDTAGVLGVDILNHLKEPVHPLACQGGKEQHRGVEHIAQTVADIGLHIPHGVGLLILHGVPFVDHDDGGFPCLVDQSGDFGVLLRDAVVGVDEDQADVCPLDGVDGAHVGILLNGVVHLALAAHTGGVDEAVFSGFVFKVGVDGVPGGACHVGDDDPFLSQDPVQEAGFAHVGLADDGNVDDVAFFLGFGFLGGVGQHPVQQITGAVAVNRGGLKQIADAQRIKFEGVGIHGADGVALVDSQSHRLAGLAQHGGHVLIRRGNAAADVRYHDDGVCQFDADLRLAAHEFQHVAVRAGLDSAGIHQGEGASAPFAVAVDPVPGDAGGILHNRGPASGQFIEQHGFAHIRPSDDGD